MHLPPRASAALAEGFQKGLPILIVLEDGLAPITTVHDVIDRTFILNPMLAGHARRVAGEQILSIVRTDTFV